MERRILRIDGIGTSVAQAARFESEERLHSAIAAHPEVLPNEDFGLGPLIPLATEFPLGSDSMDLLAADNEGHLVIVEFKRGTENPDVRAVVAQMLDYGASLWRYGYDALEEECLKRVSPRPGSLAALARQRFETLGVPLLEEDTFQVGVEDSLERGTFHFVYCGRDLGDRTRRIMTYLAEGPRMSLFAVEVDYYREGDTQSATLVPRTAFVPSWITVPSTGSGGSRSAKEILAGAPPEFHEVVERMNEVAQDMELQVSRRRTGWNYLPPVLEEGAEWPTSGVGVYATGRGVEINFSPLDDLGHHDLAQDLITKLAEVGKVGIAPGRMWPSVPYAALLRDWPTMRAKVIEPYFRARKGAAAPHMSRGSRALRTQAGRDSGADHPT